MGNQESVSAEKIAKLEERLDLIDTNRDGNVSKYELQSWMATMEAKIETKYLDTLKQRTNELNEAKKQVNELQKQLDSLLAIQEQLEAQLRVKQEVVPKAVHSEDSAVVNLSKERINAWVEEMLATKESNIKYLPDFVERQIYRNVLGLMMNLLDRVAESVYIKFLGHQLVFDIDPIPDQDPAIPVAPVKTEVKPKKSKKSKSLNSKQINEESEEKDNTDSDSE